MHLREGKAIGRGIERLQGFVLLNAGGIKQTGSGLANQFSTDGMSSGLAFAAPKKAKGHNKAVRQKRAQNHKILPWDIAQRVTRRKIFSYGNGMAWKEWCDVNCQVPKGNCGNCRTTCRMLLP